MQLFMNTFESGMTALIMENEEMNYIMEKINSLEESDFIIKDVSKLIKNEAKKQSASLLGNLLTGKGTIRTGDSTIRAGHDF